MMHDLAPTAPERAGTDDVEGVLAGMLGDTPHLRYAYERETRSLWVTMAPRPYPRLTPEMTGSFTRFAGAVRTLWGRPYPSLDQPVLFVVLRSDTPAVFSTGGDLPSMLDWVERGDTEAMGAYFRTGTRCFHALADGFGSSVVTVASVSGKAYGGGFEAARACDFIVADETARFGFPEGKFDMFPGNGAFALVGLRHGEDLLRRLVIEGAFLDGDEARAAGLVHRLAPKGGADAATRDLLAELMPRHAACLALRRGMQAAQGLTLELLLGETERYLSALASVADAAKIRHLVRVQDRALSRLAA